ncbi:MAG: tetratricopeptide repeat protein [Pirellulales bacterium]|nr:tetratricopeptide repeat protein [Pirellulales bacterium]
MSVTRWIQRGLPLGLVVALAAASAQADEASDQYAVAAGHYRAQRWQLAAEEFQAFLDKFPNDANRNPSLFFLGEALLQLENYAEARRRFHECLASGTEERFAKLALFRAGEAAYLADTSDLAKADLQSFHEKYPADELNAFVLSYLGEIALAAKDLATAEKLFQQCLQQFPEGKMQDDCRFGLARIREKQERREEAERLYLAIAGKTGSRLAEDAQFRLGAVQYAGGKYADAVKTFEPFDSRLAASPRRPTAMLGSGWAMVKLDRLDEARKYFEKIVSDPKLGTEARYWLGWILKTQDQWDAASKMLLETAQADPKHPLAPAIRFHAGDALLRAGKTAAALEQFNWVADHAEAGNEWIDDAVRGKVQAGLLAKDHASVDRDAAVFQTRFAGSPLRADVERFRAQSLLDRKDFARAVEILEPLVKAGGGERGLEERYLLSLAYEGLKRYDEARATLAPVLASADPRLKADSQLAQASLLLASQRFSEAIAPLESFLGGGPQGDAVVKGMGQLAICYARTGQLDRAKKLYVEIIAKHPGHDLLAPTTEQLAEAAYDAGERDWADKLFAWLAADGQPPEYHRKGLSGMAWSQFKAGKLEESAATFARLLETDPSPELAAEAALVRAQVLEQLKRPDAALAMFDLVIEKYSGSDRYPQALWAAAKLRDDLEQDRQAADLYERLAKEFPQFAELDAVLYRWAWALADLGQTEPFHALLKRLSTEFPESRVWADATFRLAQRAYSATQYGEATDLVKAVLDRKTAGAAGDNGIRENALYLRAQIAAAEEKWAEAQGHFDAMVKEYPDGPLRLLADYGRAEAVFRQGRYEEARLAFEQLAGKAQGRQEPWEAAVQLRLAQTLCHENKWNEAYEIASKIESQNPGFAEQFEADYVIGRCLASRADFDGARAAYRKVIKSPQGEKTETAAKAQLMIAESYFHQENYAAALREFLRLEILYAYPDLQAAAVMQAAQCHESLGEWTQAAELYDRLIKTYPKSEFTARADERLKAARQRAQKPTS